MLKRPEKELQKLMEKPKQIQDGLVNAVNIALNDASRIVKSEYLSGPRPGKLGVVTGRLRGSPAIGLARRIGNTVSGMFGTSVVYARIHEFGGRTPARTIYPKRKQALHFFSKGSEIFAKKVKHPGSNIPRRPSWRPSLEKAGQHLKARIQQVMNG
jgi:phage gpG-like protein